ncbi:enoyl-CoA hydratase/isomerase family protein [Kaustia mangrovi]|mgnify:CR=1 FL=1|uniref:Enoyl-CoA hydratase/isomerase family protein n=1 Tax=Kaustia mangrovi TaxID=2593653 RepID=A0A7S8C4A6_9HYPH|nr:enoyl-CoA hydratase-related protein [Kaustia mangrovi]QPC43091.1 enoyl-CoA hydratase/isomerase family protein [Kaustia mangrovi]
MAQTTSQSGETTILVERYGAVAVLTLNEPAKRNALSLRLREALHDELEAVLADPSVRVIVLTGAEGCFCAGGDLSSMGDLDGPGGRARLKRAHRLVRQLVRGEKPVIAAVEGYAVGAGLSLAAACDLVITARDAHYAGGFAKVGLMPDLGALWTVPARAGTGATRRIFFLGETLDGEEAERVGLADQVVEPGHALEEALRAADRLVAAAPLAIAMAKATLARAPQGLDALLDGEADGQAVLFTTEDFHEGVTAFLEKRKATFSGR